MKKLLMRSAFSFAVAVLPLVAVAQSDNGSYLASLFEQVRILQEQVSALLAQISQRSSGTAQLIGALPSTTDSGTTELAIAAKPSTTFRIGTPSRIILGQSFTAIGSSIEGVDVALVRRGNPSIPIKVILFSMQEGDLAETTVTPSNLSDKYLNPTWVPVKFSRPVPVIPGKEYRIWLQTESIEGSVTNYYRWAVESKNPYPGGTFYTDDALPQYDALMKVRFTSDVTSRQELKIAPVQGLDKTVVAGAHGVELARFTLDATGAGEDMRVVNARILADVISGDLDNFQNLQLFEGSTPLNTGIHVVNPADTLAGADKELAFVIDDSFIVPKGSIKTFSLMGNVTTGAQTSDVVKFDFSAPISNGGWLVTGAVSGGNIAEILSNVHGSAITIGKNGGWAVLVAPSQPTEKWVAAGSMNVPVNVLRFTATTEDFALTDLRLQLKGPATAADVVKISLWDGTVKITEKVPTFVGGVEDFTFPISGSGSFVIPKDSYKDMTIKVDVPGIGRELPGTAGKFVIVDFDGNGTPLGKNKAIGKLSGTSAHTSSVIDTSSFGIRYFRSVPIVQRLVIPTNKLQSGNLVLYKFSVAADPAHDVALGSFTFTVATTGIVRMADADPSFVLWNITENKRVSSMGGWRAYVDNYSNYDSTNNLVVKMPTDQVDYLNPWVTIPAGGQTHTFELRANITTDGVGDSVATRLLGDSFSVPIGAYSEVVVSGDRISNFIWSDFSGDITGIHSLSTRDWMNGYKVPGLLPTGLDASVISN